MGPSGFRFQLAIQRLQPDFESPERPFLSLQSGGNCGLAFPESIETLPLRLLREPHFLALSFERHALRRIIAALDLAFQRLIALVRLTDVNFDPADLVTQLSELPVEPFHPLIVGSNPFYQHLFALGAALGMLEDFAYQPHLFEQSVVAATGHWRGSAGRWRHSSWRLRMG
jgi:hypothetical protein